MKTTTPDCEYSGTPWLAELLPALHEGDAAAQREVVDRLLDKLTKTAIGCWHFDEDIANDAAEDALIAVLRRVTMNKPATLYEAYFFSAAYRRAARLRRQQSRRNGAVSLDQPVTVDNQSGGKLVDLIEDPKARDEGSRRELQETIAAAIDSLDEKYREIAKLYFVPEPPARATLAKILNKTPDQVRYAIEEARKQLRVFLARNLEDE